MADKQTLPRLTLTVPQAAALLGVHPITLYSGLAEGSIQLRHLRIGRRILIPVNALDEFVAGGRPPRRRPGRPRKGAAG
ncbi:MAG: helix-turn-helix domain-containing protein [Acidiferrobacterales bacterium]